MSQASSGWNGTNWCVAFRVVCRSCNRREPLVGVYPRVCLWFFVFLACFFNHGWSLIKEPVDNFLIHIFLRCWLLNGRFWFDMKHRSGLLSNLHMVYFRIGMRFNHQYIIITSIRWWLWLLWSSWLLTSVPWRSHAVSNTSLCFFSKHVDLSCIRLILQRHWIIDRLIRLHYFVLKL